MAVDPPAAHAPLAIRSQRLLQIVLGGFWILDAALQFQPFMFGQGFVDKVILPNAIAQPFVLGDFIAHIGRFLSPDIAVWNTFFALIQLFIGVTLLFRRTVRTGLAVSFVWVLGVWVIGEGMGMVLTGAASALTGAPGSVLVYGLLSLMAWPRPPRGDSPAGVASSAAAQGIGRSVTPLVVWAGYWSLAAVLFLLPDNRPGTAIQSTVDAMTSGEPAWYSQFLTHIGNFVSTAGTGPAWLLALVALVVGLGPLLVRRPGGFLAAGGVFAVLLWVAGQGLAGGLLTGSATDPNTGPLIVVLALAMVPTVVATRDRARSPAGEVRQRMPAVVGLSACALAATLVLSGSYPAPAQTGPSAMPGMSMSGGGPSAPAATAGCTSQQTGPPLMGLEVSNTPMMIMAGTLGMDMNGEDASAAAGLNTTVPNWAYTGPALPRAEAAELIADGADSAADLHLARSGCAPTITTGEEIGAQQYVQQTSEAAAKYATPAEATAAGYVAVSPASYPIVYYVDPAAIAADARARRTLDPSDLDGLIYVKTPASGDVLAAAFYVLPSTVTGVPMPYGALVQWHERTQVCGPETSTSTGTLDITGFPPCSGTSVVQSTPYLTMVWQVPVAGGPLAIQPPDIQIVEAAVMAATAKA
jgi:hypothetical protein